MKCRNKGLWRERPSLPKLLALLGWLSWQPDWNWGAEERRLHFLMYLNYWYAVVFEGCLLPKVWDGEGWPQRHSLLSMYV